MKKTLLAAGTILALSSSFTVSAAENDKPQYLSGWWYQSVNVVGSYHIHFGPQLRNNTYLEHEAFTKKDQLSFYGHADAPVFFDSSSDTKSIWNHGSPLFVEVESCFSVDKLTNTDLSFGPFKEWYSMNNYTYDMGRNRGGRQSTWHMGLSTDIDTGLPMSLSMNVHAKYRWQNYGTANENEWDSYHFEVKYLVPATDLWGGQLDYIGFTNFDWGFNLGDNSGYTGNGIKTCTNNSIASSHILALSYDHWHYSVVTRCWHNGGRWNDDAELNFGNGDFNVRLVGWGGYLAVGCSFQL